MMQSKYIVHPVMDDEEENEKENKPEAQSSFLMKKMEQLFLEKSTIYLWGVVDDKSARDIVSKLLLLDADKPGRRSNSLLIARVEWLPAV